jgi:hypothetical protein
VNITFWDADMTLAKARMKLLFRILIQTCQILICALLYGSKGYFCLSEFSAKNNL